MKIKIKDIEANPYRKINEYPIDEEKVKALMNSINEKTFWDNILVRPHPEKNGKYQLAYGHHRLVALQKLRYIEIDIPCRDIDETMMLKIMAEENLNWSTAPIIMTQTIISAKEFLDNELAKYDDWATSPEIWKGLFESQKSFETTKGMGIGEPTLTKFLGGNWTKHRVGTALNIIKDKKIEIEAIKIIPTMEQAKNFKVAVNEYNTPKDVQIKIAQKIKDEGIGCRDVAAEVEKHSPPIPNIKKVKKKKFLLKDVAEYVMQTESKTRDLRHRYERLMPETKELIKKGRLLIRLIQEAEDLSKTLQEYINECEKEYNQQNNNKKKKVASIQILD